MGWPPSGPDVLGGGMQGARLGTLSWPNLLGYSFVYLVFPYIYMVYTIY